MEVLWHVVINAESLSFKHIAISSLTEVDLSELLSSCFQNGELWWRYVYLLYSEIRSFDP